MDQLADTLELLVKAQLELQPPRAELARIDGSGSLQLVECEGVEHILHPALPKVLLQLRVQRAARRRLRRRALELRTLRDENGVLGLIVLQPARVGVGLSLQRLHGCHRVLDL